MKHFKKNSNSFSLILGLSFCLLLYFPGLAQTDNYHNWLLNQLETDYGLTGGTWVYSAQETNTMSRIFTQEGVTRTAFDVNDMPFSKAVRLKTEDRPNNYWEYSALFTTENTLNTDEVLLAVFWVRGLQAERGKGFINTTFEKGSAPFNPMFFNDLGLRSEWQQYLIPFKMTEQFDKAWLTLKLGYLAQEIELGGVAIINYGNSYQVAELPSMINNTDYDGRAPDAAWRAEAQSRIEEHRMQDLNITALDGTGIPIPNAAIQVKMLQHEFGFGTVVAQNNWMDHPQRATYREKILNLTGDGRSFNMIVLENGMKWQLWENNFFPGPKEETAALVQDFVDQGIRVRGHTLLWTGFQWLPNDIEANKNDPQYVRNRLSTFLDEIMNYPGIKDNIAEWDVINEPAHLLDFADIFGNTDIYADVFKQVKRNDPNAKLYINEYDIITRMGVNLTLQESYQSIINDIEQKGGQVDGIGIQGHVGYPLTPPETVYEILESLADDEKSISVTEYDAVGVDESIGGEYMRDLLTILFSHPSVDNFLMWGIWDPIHWRDDSPMFRTDWSIKPSGQAFIDLVFDEWWTDEAGTTDMNGTFQTNAFLGKHLVEITHNGITKVDTIQLDGSQTEFQISLDLTTNTTETINAIANLEASRPNPSSSYTILPFQLEKAGKIRLSLFNTLGVPIRTLLDERMTAGPHQVELNVADLPAGQYIYRLETEAGHLYRTLLVVH